MRKKVIVFLCLLFMASLLFAAGSREAAGAKKITLTLWDENQLPIIQKNVNEFNEIHKGDIEVTISQIPWSDYWIKLDASLVTTEAPDVMWMNVYLKKYVDGGVLLPIDDFVKKDGMDLYSQYVEGRVDAFREGGSLYALPKGLDSVFVALNKEIFSKYNVALPTGNWTWEDMKSTAAQLRDAIAAAKGTEYPIVMELDAQPSWLNFIYQNGGQYLTADKRRTEVGEAPAVESIQNLLDLMKEGLMAPYTVLSETKGTDLFISNKAAIVFIGSWKAPVLENSTLGMNGSIELIQMPKLKKDNHSVGGGLGYAIAKNSKNPDAAWELVKYLTGDVAMTVEAENGIDFPANKVAQASYATSFKNINGQVIVDAGLTSFPYPFNGNTEWTTKVADAVALVLSGQGEIKATLTQVQNESNAIMARMAE